MKKIEKKVKEYIKEKFNGIAVVNTEIEYLEEKYNIKIRVIFDHIDPIEIESLNNYYTDEEFNFDYIKLTIFTAIKNHVLDSYIKGSRYYYDE